MGICISALSNQILWYNFVLKKYLSLFFSPNHKDTYEKTCQIKGDAKNGLLNFKFYGLSLQMHGMRASTHWNLIVGSVKPSSEQAYLHFLRNPPLRTVEGCMWVKMCCFPGFYTPSDKTLTTIRRIRYYSGLRIKINKAPFMIWNKVTLTG